MRREAYVVQFLLDQQAAWHAHFPALRGRTHALLVGYLCTKGRRGSAARQLYGAAKELFQIDDATVRERIADVQRLDYILIDPPNERLTGRSILAPSPSLLSQYGAYTHALAIQLCATAAAMEPARTFTPHAALTERHQNQVHAIIENYTGAWLATADTLLESAQLSAARRLEARRRLMTTSYWTLMHRALEERYAMLETRQDTGLLADQVAASVLALNGQGIHTIREHIGALIELGLFERRRDRVMRIALSHPATQGFHAMLTGFAQELIDTAARLDNGDTTGAPEPMAEQTLRFLAPPAGGDATLNGVRYRLTITDPPDAARRIPLSSDPLSVGRTTASDMVLPKAEVSRNHCQIQLTDGGVVVTDTESTNGTFVDGHRISAPTAMRVGGTLKIGPFSLTLEFDDSTH